MKRAAGTSIAMQQASFQSKHTVAVRSLYRRLMKDRWAHTHMSRSHWHEWCYYVRSRIEENRDVTEPGKIAELMQEGETFLKRIKDPKPYRLPWTEGGSCWQRNVPIHPVFAQPPEAAWEGNWDLERKEGEKGFVYSTSEADYYEMEYGRPNGVYDKLRIPRPEESGENGAYTPTPEMEALEYPFWRDYSLSAKKAELDKGGSK